MIKRPLNIRFNQAVLDGRKLTTIRASQWPVRLPIMLYNWEGKPYRSKQVNIAPIIVTGFWTICIAKTESGKMRYIYGMENSKPLWSTEGFDSQADMDEWFSQIVKPGRMTTQYLMRFRLLKKVETP
jgi:hypothetical protein